MIRRYVTRGVAAALLFLLLTPANARFEKSFVFESGAVTADRLETAPFEPEAASGAQIKNNLTVSGGTIATDTYVTNGPIDVYWGSITGAVTTNPAVSISGGNLIQGPIYRKNVSFQPKNFDHSKVPDQIPVKGEFSTNGETVINSNGQYYNMNINHPLTIDTTRGDVFVIANYLNIGSEIRIVGKHRAVLIVKHGMNVNHRYINSTTKYPKFDLVLQGWSLHLQNDIVFYGNLYFEGYSLYLRNKTQVHGAIYAPQASVELDASTLYGAINCERLSLYQNAAIYEKK